MTDEAKTKLYPAAPPLGVVEQAGSAPPKAGWKSTETWLTFAGFGVLAFVLERLTELLPLLATQPGMPGWVVAIIPVAMAGIAWVMKAAGTKYLQARTELKLSASNPPATPSASAEIINK
jgi:hypothetical protein